MRQMLDEEMKTVTHTSASLHVLLVLAAPSAFGTMRSNVGSYLAHLLSSGC